MGAPAHKKIDEMKPPLSCTLTAVPRTSDVGSEIAKAIEALQAHDVADTRHWRADVASLRHDLQLMKRDFHGLFSGLMSEIRSDLADQIDKAGYRRDQPRWLKGHGRISGRWSGGAGRLAAERDYNKRIKGGHHYVPKELYENLFAKQLLKPETREIFHHEVTGPLPPGVHKNDKPHRAYTKAVFALWRTFLKQHGVTSKEMSPALAHKFVDEVLHSNNPKIRDYNARLR